MTAIEKIRMLVDKYHGFPQTVVPVSVELMSEVLVELETRHNEQQETETPCA